MTPIRARRRISLRTRASLPLLALAGLAGCASVPDRSVVPEGFAPPGTPVDVHLLWDGGGPAPFYNQTSGGATASLLGSAGGDGALLAVLLLPVTLAIDAGIAASNNARERQARRLADSVTGLPDRASVEGTLAEVLRAELGWAAPGPAGGSAPSSPGAQAPAPLRLGITPIFALRQDARALLFEFRLSVCRADAFYEGKMCADNRPLEGKALVHSDSLARPVNDDATRSRLVAVINGLYDTEGLSDADRAAQQRARDAALRHALDKKLSREEELMLAVDTWVADGGARLKGAFEAAIRQFAETTRAMRDHPGPPGRNDMSVTRAIFPGFYTDLSVGDLDVVEVEPDGRRTLRSRFEPVRAGFMDFDPASNVWFSVPAPLDDADKPEEALIDFLYRPAVAPR